MKTNCAGLDRFYKILVIGESNVGKTSIILRYTDNEFKNSGISTCGVDVKCKYVSLDDLKIRLDIWDTAGQERFRGLAKNYFRGANASIGILVYDIRRKESFESIKDYWYEQVKTSGEENMVFGVVGNKCDLFQEEKVSEDEGKKFAKEIGAVFQLTSCKENIGIDELFQQCAQKFMESNNLATFTEQKKNDNIKLDSSNKNNNNGGNTQKRRFC